MNDRKLTRDAEGSILKRVEERRTSGGRTKKVTVYYARVRRNEYDEQGNFVRAHELKRKADSHDDAITLRRRLHSELQAKIEAPKAGKPKDRVYFYDLLDFYEKHYVKEAVYSGEKKLAGQRTPVKETKARIGVYREFFGDMPVRDITYSRLFDFKVSLQETEYKVRRKLLVPNPDPKSRKREYRCVDEWRKRKPATVHRYLALLRRILYVGVHQGFIGANPFKQGDPLIVASVEETRTRICTFQEEEALLAQCVGPRAHLKQVIICAIDTFLRESELMSLVGSDIDFVNRVVIVRSRNTKTLKTRTVPLTDRAYEAFSELREGRTREEWASGRVFPFHDVKGAWTSAIAKAAISDLRFHDLRGTGITRMLDAGIPESIVMKLSGHTQFTTFMKYVKKDLQMIQDAGSAMSRLHAERVAQLAAKGQPTAKGHLPLSRGLEAGSRPQSDVTELGETVN